MKAIIGSVFQRKDGRWVAQYSIDGKRKLIYGKTEDEVILKRQDVFVKINLSLLPEHSHFNANSIPAIVDNYSNSVCSNTNVNEHYGNSSAEEMEYRLMHLTLGEWLTEWLASYVEPNKNTSTHKGYELYINKHITPSIGDIKLHELSTAVFQDFFNNKTINGRLDGKYGGMSPKSLENMRYMLNSAICKAIENELISENYISDVTIIKEKNKETMTLSREEERRLTATCLLSENISAYGIIVAMYAGLQLGELLALKWEDIDIPNKQIYVNQSLSRCFDDTDTGSKSVLRFAKSKTSRVIFTNDLPKDFFADINDHQSKQLRLFGCVPKAVITSSTGGYMDPGNYNKLFKRMLNESGIPNANFDILRNTFALRYLERNFDPVGLSIALGCSGTSKSIKKFIKIYNKRQLRRC